MNPILSYLLKNIIVMWGKGYSSDKISYFQPILDKLDYKPSIVEPIPDIVITEGKNDWYTLKYFSRINSKDL